MEPKKTLNNFFLVYYTVLKIFEPVLCTTFLVWIIEQILRHMKGLLYGYLYVIRWSLLFLLVIKKNIAVH